MSHTPGPWKTDAGRCIVTDRGAFVVTPVRDNDAMGWAGGFDELDSNVRLMAAAPQLLEACKLLQSYWSRGLWPDDGSEVADMVAAAVRKAQWRNT